jgi:hypothetical protein
MLIEKLQAAAANNNFLIFNFCNQTIHNIVSSISYKNKHIKKILVVDETWYFQESFDLDIKNNLNSDLVLTFSFMDHSHLDYKIVNQHNIPMFNIGYYKNSKYWCDVLSLFVSKHFSLDEKLLTNGKEIDIPFMSLNGKPHPHRTELINNLKQLQLTKKGYVSYNPFGLENCDSIKLDIIIDNQEFPPGDNATASGAMSLGNIKYWNKHFLNLVTETLPDPSELNFWTEKTWKPILGLRPFLTYAPKNNLSMMQQHNFLDYANDFNDITDLDLLNHYNQPKFLKVLSDQSTEYFQSKYKILHEKTLFNRRNFKRYVEKQHKIISQLKEIAI